jgi:hypothetical protein
MNSEQFWKIVKTFNILMREAIDGPNCTNLTICQGNCCSIKIDVPKILAEEYVKRGYATTEDFIRSNVFSFQLRFDDKTGKCFLFEKKINGCSVHSSGIKPPQCWIYPTNFSNPKNEEIRCKKVSGWKIVDKEKAKKAEILLKEYITYCENEANDEILKISERINEDSLRDYMSMIPPSHLGGFKDTWDEIQLLPAEGFSLQMKKFCKKYNNTCPFLKNNFMNCESVCEEVIKGLISFLKNILLKFIKERGADVNGHYPFYKLFDSFKKS